MNVACAVLAVARLGLPAPRRPMKDTPATVMRSYVEAMQRGDWDAGLGYLADDVVLHVPGRSPLAGEHRGRAAARGYLDAAVAHAGDVEVELIDTLVGEERVALLVRERLTREDRVLDMRRANVYRVEGGQITE